MMIVHKDLQEVSLEDQEIHKFNEEIDQKAVNSRNSINELNNAIFRHKQSLKDVSPDEK